MDAPGSDPDILSSSPTPTSAAATTTLAVVTGATPATETHTLRVTLTPRRELPRGASVRMALHILGPALKRATCFRHEIVVLDMPRAIGAKWWIQITVSRFDRDTITPGRLLLVANMLDHCNDKNTKDYELAKWKANQKGDAHPYSCFEDVEIAASLSPPSADATIAMLSQRLDKSNADNAALRVENAALKAENAALRSENNSLKEQVALLMARVDALEREVKELKERKCPHCGK